MDFMHPMTTDCFTADPNQSLLASCRTPDTTQFVDTIPVTSQTTGNTYWNRACAACNEDDNDIIDWTPNVIFKRAIPYFTVPPSVGAEFPDTFDKLLPFVNSRRGQGDIIYKPPTSMEDNVCLRKDSIYIDYCKPSPARNNQALEGWTSDACDKFYNPVYGTAQPFMNIFCFICQYKIEPKDKDIACRKSFSKAGSGILQAVLDYRRNEGNKEKYGIAASTVKDKRCTCTEIYDPYLVSNLHVKFSFTH